MLLLPHIYMIATSWSNTSCQSVWHILLNKMQINICNFSRHHLYVILQCKSHVFDFNTNVTNGTNKDKNKEWNQVGISLGINKVYNYIPFSGNAVTINTLKPTNNTLLRTECVYLHMFVWQCNTSSHFYFLTSLCSWQFMTVEASSGRILKLICFLLVEGQWHDQ
jgi:hypothetical protein